MASENEEYSTRRTVAPHAPSRQPRRDFKSSYQDDVYNPYSNVNLGEISEVNRKPKKGRIRRNELTPTEINNLSEADKKAREKYLAGNLEEIKQLSYVETKGNFGKVGEAHTDGKPPVTEERDEKITGFSVVQLEKEGDVLRGDEQRIEGIDSGKLGTGKNPDQADIVYTENDHLLPISDRVQSFGDSPLPLEDQHADNDYEFAKNEDRLIEPVDATRIEGDINVDFNLESVSDKVVREFLIKKGLSFVENVWENCRFINIYSKKDSFDLYINLNAYGKGFVAMKLVDFFNMCNLPDFNNGNSHLKSPATFDKKEILSTINRIKVNNRANGAIKKSRRH